MKRWLAVITYRFDTGPCPVEHEIEELEELQLLIERGPDWRTIEDIKVTLQRGAIKNFTIEQSAAQWESLMRRGD